MHLNGHIKNTIFNLKGNETTQILPALSLETSYSLPAAQAASVKCLAAILDSQYMRVGTSKRGVGEELGRKREKKHLPAPSPSAL